MGIVEVLNRIADIKDRSSAPSLPPQILKSSPGCFTEMSEKKLNELNDIFLKYKVKSIRVYSHILSEIVWFCSNDIIAEEIKSNTPNAVCYAVNELRELMELKPDPESLKGIHKVKRMFPGSKIKENTFYNG